MNGGMGEEPIPGGVLGELQARVGNDRRAAM